jgi:hypothetical protein
MIENRLIENRGKNAAWTFREAETNELLLTGEAGFF